MTAAHLTLLARVAMPAVLILGLTGCSGGLPELPSMPSLAALAADTETAQPAAEPNAPAAKPDAKVADVSDVNTPGPLGDKFIGKANAPVTIVEYGSMTCPVCAKFHADALPKVKKAYIDKGKVRLVYREFPIGRSAAAATMAVRCVDDKNYFKAIDKFYATQKEWVAQEVKKDEIFKVVQPLGVKREKFDACLGDQKLNDALVQVKQRGRNYGVAGTPTFYVNGRKMAGDTSFEQMQTVIEAALKEGGAPAQAQKPQAAPAKKTASAT
jgi:protein-disulfide isomerase